MSDMVCGRLRELRRKNGYTQSGLAKALGVSQSTVGNWENVNAEVALRLAEQIKKHPLIWNLLFMVA